MLRSLALWTVALVLLGCKSGGNVVDPFVGRTKVEPPRTGSVSAPPGDPYYAPPARPSGVWAPPAASGTTGAPISNPGVAPSGSAPAAGAPARTGTVRPPAFEANRSSSAIRIPTPTASVRTNDQNQYPDVAANPAPPAIPAKAETANPAGAPASVVATQGVVRVIEPRAPPAASASGEPRRLDTATASTATPIPGNVVADNQTSVDLATLPPVRNGVSPATADPSTATHQVQLASAVVPAAAAACACQASPTGGALQPTPATSGDGYGYDSQYQWLRGLLDYAPAERAWRLRYIPVGSPADGLGGSVFLCNPKSLSGFERGQMVEVRGRLVQRTNGRCTSTVYEVSEIRRLAGHAASVP